MLIMGVEKVIPRSDYMDRKVDHETYYGQFVTDGVRVMLKAIGEDRIRASADPYFNDIPLKLWDNLSEALPLGVIRMISIANGGGVSLSDRVCVLKAAARQLCKEVQDHDHAVRSQ